MTIAPLAVADDVSAQAALIGEAQPFGQALRRGVAVMEAGPEALQPQLAKAIGYHPLHCLAGIALVPIGLGEQEAHLGMSVVTVDLGRGRIPRWPGRRVRGQRPTTAWIRRRALECGPRERRAPAPRYPVPASPS